VVTPPLEALEDFKVLRSNYSADFGGAVGGVINVVTKQGLPRISTPAFMSTSVMTSWTGMIIS
jgi:outer membrane receptor protein involved in Fe transport